MEVFSLLLVVVIVAGGGAGDRPDRKEQLEVKVKRKVSRHGM